VPHVRALAKLRPWVCRVVSCRVVRSRLKPQHYKTLTMSLNPTTFTEPLLSLNHDRTTLGALTVTFRFFPLRLLLTYIRRAPPPAQVANSH
jgi:hypothetical protein